MTKVCAHNSFKIVAFSLIDFFLLEFILFHEMTSIYFEKGEEKSSSHFDFELLSKNTRFTNRHFVKGDKS